MVRRLCIVILAMDQAPPLSPDVLTMRRAPEESGSIGSALKPMVRDKFSMRVFSRSTRPTSRPMPRLLACAISCSNISFPNPSPLRSERTIIAKLGFHAVWIAHCARHAQGFGHALRIDGLGDESHFPVIVDLGQPRQFAARKLASHLKDAQADILWVELFQEAPVLGLVFWTDGSHGDRATVADGGSNPLHGIGKDREPVRTGSRGGRDAYARVERQRTVLVGC